MRIPVIISMLISAGSLYSQTIIIDTLRTTQQLETQDIYWLQVPSSYTSDIPTPLLLGWHGLGGNELQMDTCTAFDEECEERGWLCASIRGAPSDSWTNRETQNDAVLLLQIIDEKFNLDRSRIYMTGASMGGGSGMIFSNNHLDPSGFMVAATVSISGIMDDYRRFLEQGTNHSMMAAFGGSPSEIPFEYQRNSPTYFNNPDSSMHWNLKHLPVNLTVGSTDYPWVWHAQDMYELLWPYVDTVYYEQNGIAGHGWQVAVARDLCDWLSNFTLNDKPSDICINADEPQIYYWTEVVNQMHTGFTRYDAEYFFSENRLDITIHFNMDTLAVDLVSIELNPLTNLYLNLDIVQAESCVVSLQGFTSAPIMILRDSVIYNNWNYDPMGEILNINSNGNHQFIIVAGADNFVKAICRTKSPSILGSDNLQTEIGFIIPSDKAEIYDILGRRVGMGNLFLYDLPNGIYLIKVQDVQAMKVYKVVFVK